MAEAAEEMARKKAEAMAREGEEKARQAQLQGRAADWSAHGWPSHSLMLSPVTDIAVVCFKILVEQGWYPKLYPLASLQPLRPDYGHWHVTFYDRRSRCFLLPYKSILWFVFVAFMYGSLWTSEEFLGRLPFMHAFFQSSFQSLNLQSASPLAIHSVKGWCQVAVFPSGFHFIFPADILETSAPVRAGNYLINGENSTVWWFQAMFIWRTWFHPCLRGWSLMIVQSSREGINYPLGLREWRQTPDFTIWCSLASSFGKFGGLERGAMNMFGIRPFLAAGYILRIARQGSRTMKHDRSCLISSR